LRHASYSMPLVSSYRSAGAREHSSRPKPNSACTTLLRRPFSLPLYRELRTQISHWISLAAAVSYNGQEVVASLPCYTPAHVGSWWHRAPIFWVPVIQTDKRKKSVATQSVRALRLLRATHLQQVHNMHICILW